MTSHYTQNNVTVIGHKHPDTDSVCSAIAYSWLKNQNSDTIYEPRCAGPINRETEFALNYFGMEAPRIYEDVSPQVKNIEFRLQPGIDQEMSMRDAWNLMRDVEINTLCITDNNQNLLGLISLKDIANANMDLLDTASLSAAKTPYRNVLHTLQGKLLAGDPDGIIAEGRICIGTSVEMMQNGIRKGDIVLVSDRQEIQSCAIGCGASCIVVCCGARPSSYVLKQANENNCAVFTTSYDTYQASRLISTAVPIRHFMVKDDILKFSIDTPLEDVKKVMARVRYQYFPVLNEDGKYCGVVSRRNLLNLHRNLLILVDHNEKSQAVDGLEEAEVLEIIDHHRLGAPETDAPVVFRNMPVGCTATIVYQLFLEQQIIPPPQIAGLMLSAILSDTLMFRSPTSTILDKKAAYALADLAHVSINEYAEKMFEAGSDLAGKTAEDILFSDFKTFNLEEQKIGIGQACLMTDKSCKEAESLIVPFLNAALAKANVTMLFFMLTNTPEQSTKVLFAGENTALVLKKAFKQDPSGHVVTLSGVVSRKKQFLPAIKKALKLI